MAFGSVPIEIPANDPYLSKYNIGCLDFVRSQPIFRNDCKFSAAEFVRIFYIIFNGNDTVLLLRVIPVHIGWIALTYMEVYQTPLHIYGNFKTEN